jgi:hypothetical protein
MLSMVEMGWYRRGPLERISEKNCLAAGSRRVWSPQLSPTSGEKGLSRTPAAFQTSAGDYVAEDNVKISIEFQKSALTKNANAALLCSVVSLGHGEMLGRRGLPLRPQRKSMAP